eukprot:7391975-Prymnesium_polylepis.1
MSSSHRPCPCAPPAPRPDPRRTWRATRRGRRATRPPTARRERAALGDAWREVGPAAHIVESLDVAAHLVADLEDLLISRDRLAALAHAIRRLRALHVGRGHRARRDRLGHAADAPVEAALPDELVVGGDGEVQVGAQRLGVVVALVEEEWLQRRARLLRVRVADRDEVGAPNLAVADASPQRPTRAVEVQHRLGWPVECVGLAQRLREVGVEERGALDGVALASAIGAHRDVHGLCNHAELGLTPHAAHELRRHHEVGRVVWVLPDADRDVLIRGWIVHEREQLEPVPDVDRVPSRPMLLHLGDGARGDRLGDVLEPTRLGQALEVAAAMQGVGHIVDRLALAPALDHPGHVRDAQPAPVWHALLVGGFSTRWRRQLLRRQPSFRLQRAEVRLRNPSAAVDAGARLHLRRHLVHLRRDRVAQLLQVKVIGLERRHVEPHRRDQVARRIELRGHRADPSRRVGLRDIELRRHRADPSRRVGLRAGELLAQLESGGEPRALHLVHLPPDGPS